MYEYLSSNCATITSDGSYKSTRHTRNSATPPTVDRSRYIQPIYNGQETREGKNPTEYLADRRCLPRFWVELDENSILRRYIILWGHNILDRYNRPLPTRDGLPVKPIMVPAMPLSVTLCE